LRKLTLGDLDRLIIQVPVRHGKSEMVTVRYTAWRIERDPRLKVILGAYNQTIANRFSRKVRRIIENNGKVRLNPERSAVSEWETVQGGGLRAAGVGAGVTGWGGDLVVVDDPVKNREEADSPTYRQKVWDWWNDDLFTRREPGAATILIMSRWHKRDLVGRILEEDGDKWTVVNLPAIAGENDPLGRDPGEALCPQRYDEEALTDIRESTTDRTWWSLYQQSPRADTGTIFDESWWEPAGARFDLSKRKPDVAGRYISLDTAEGDDEENAYTVGVVGELRHNYLLDIVSVWRERIAFPDLPDEVEALARRWNADRKLKGVIIEYKSSGVQVHQTLMATGPEWLQEILNPWTPSASKEMRAEQAAVWCRNGMIRLPWPGPEWLTEFTEELYDFPASAYRDQVDAFSQLVIYLEHFIEQGWRGRRSD
jgi:predicted phage terminase large subunit-like protein